jgi:hypothetical protein
VSLCPFIGPVAPTCTRTKNPSIATPPLSGAIGDYCLFFTSGFHRPLDLCEGQQSWRQPNANQPATSNCSTHDPVTRRLHRQHHLLLVHPQFVRAWMWSKVGFTSWNRLVPQMGPRWAGSGSEPRGPQPTPWPTDRGACGAGREGGALHRPCPWPPARSVC